MESAVTAPVSGHIKRVVVHEGGHLVIRSRFPNPRPRYRRLHQPG